MSEVGKTCSKLAPFKYPNKKHQRTESPPAFTKYRDYKPFLKREFNGRCVYCCKLDLGQDPSAFHVEHYRPKSEKWFPELETIYTNLFYSCAGCNRRKGIYWHERSAMRILNPCEYVMSQHLRFNNETVDNHTAQGELNIELLGLNNTESLAYRKSQSETVLLLIEGLISYRGTKDKVKINWINRAVSKISELTQQTEDRIRNVCKI